MSDTLDDIQIRKIEERIKASRDPRPCDSFAPVSNRIPLCSFCGHDKESHDDHEEKLTITKAYVPTIEEVEREYKMIIGDRKRPKDDKIALIGLLKQKVVKIEMEAAFSSSYPLEKIYKLKDLIKRISEWMEARGAKF